MTVLPRSWFVRVLFGLLAAAVLVVGLPQAGQAADAPTPSAGRSASATPPAGSSPPVDSSPPTDSGATSTSTGDRGAILIGTSGFEFEDLDPQTTPNLWAMMQSAQIGTMTPRSVRSVSCPVDGWLAVGSGRRAADEPRPQCRVPQPPLDGWVADWDVYAQVARGDNYDAALGGLAEAVPSISAFGPGAAIAAADPTGRIEAWSPIGDDIGPRAAAASEAGELTIVDLGNSAADGYSLRDLDRRVGAVLSATGWMTADAADGIGEGTSPVIFASIADGTHDGSSMQATMMLQPGEKPGLLTSSSTRQPGLVQVPDIAPTLVQLSGGEPMGNVAGAPMSSTPGGSWESRYQSVLDRQVAVKTQNEISTWFFPVVATLMVVLLVLAWFLRRRHAELVRSGAYRLGIVFAAMPVSTYLVNTVPWERATNPDIAMLGALVGWALVLGALALLGPWSRHRLGPVLFVCVVTVTVLGYDVVTGSQLQMSTLLGEPLLIASRFYGIGNSALALYCCALLLAVAGFASMTKRPMARLSIVLIPVLVSCALLAAPGLGTKFGSVPTLIIGVAYLALASAGIRFSLKRLGLTVGIAGFVMLLVLFLDWLRPANQRTHFGRFFDSLISGEALGVLARKIDMNIDILTQSWMTVILPLVIIAVFWAALMPQRFGLRGLVDAYARIPLLRAGMISLAILLGVGTIINDSGIVVPAVGILFLVPVLAHLETFRTPSSPAEATAATRLTSPAGPPPADAEDAAGATAAADAENPSGAESAPDSGPAASRSTTADRTARDGVSPTDPRRLSDRSPERRGGAPS
ncbi:hypothetical protein [Brevibacterium casei]|uniref:hypothetical protein n=1 Tax=Brevibacterium casei TaxID=33889 RepID=UPI0011A95E37|nr:hypothetical protein [Brevibacterium casei]MCT1551353.1 hypothetical protein [Brevibacterium casei]MCT1562023.1 hypothetical protein [Brevibacterium casei]MCT1767695.1 hypothetical protein [Brevibacterium casei]MCT2209875.1 hypothetical protein [Brevibacterium casei]MDH5147810.1 hypothetical protein [Brevibacterium casei]